MRSELLQLVFYAIALVVGGACETALPKGCGVGVPVLMALVAGVAARQRVPTLVLFAFAAGAFEDALSGLPMMTSASYFLVLALLVWRVRFPRLAVVVAYPLYEIWIKAVVPGLMGGLGLRIALAIPVALVTAFAVVPLLAWLERKAAVDVA